MILGISYKENVGDLRSSPSIYFCNKCIKNQIKVYWHDPFIDSIKNVKDGDFVYLDPPYAPENSKSFVGYVQDGFNLKTHELLFAEIKKLENIKFIMSNAKVDIVTDCFKDYNCDEIIARRAINSKNPGSTTIEVIIYN